MENIVQNSPSQSFQKADISQLYQATQRTTTRNTQTGSHAQPTDSVTISTEAKQISTQQLIGADKSNQDSHEALPDNEQALPPEKIQELQRLQKRDAEVRAHEQAHKATAGQYAAGGPSYTFEVGPNGKRYAVGGEVPIDLSKEATPEATLLKMQIVSRAAMAPANPSSADRRIAARASMIASQARSEMQSELSASMKDNLPESDAEKSGDEASTVSSVSRNGNSSSIGQNTRRMILSTYQSQSV